MKRFYKKSNHGNIIIIIILIIVLIIDVIFFDTLGSRLGNNISIFSKLKIDEITKYYLNNTIKKYSNIDTNNYIKLNIVNNEIISVDIDNKNANILLNNIIDDINNNVKNLELGNINEYYNLEYVVGDNGIIIYMPIGVIFNNSLFSSIGSKIPVKISFFEVVDAYVDVKVDNYGINNSLVKLYINISVKETLEMPIKKRTSSINYNYLISSRLINGKVPSILGGNIGDNSNIVNTDVKG